MSAPDPGLQAFLGTLAGLSSANSQAILDHDRQRRRTQEAEKRAEEEGQLRRETERRQREAQERENDALMLCPEHPEDRLSSVKIDTALTKHDAAEVQVVTCVTQFALFFDSVPSGPAHPPT